VKNVWCNAAQRCFAMGVFLLSMPGHSLAVPVLQGKAGQCADGTHGNKVIAPHPFPARVLEISGEAWLSIEAKKNAKGAPPPVVQQLFAQGSVPLGAKVITGPNSFLSLVLMDCTKVVFPSLAEVHLQEVRSGNIRKVVRRANNKKAVLVRSRFIARFDLKRGSGEFYVPPMTRQRGKSNADLRQPLKNELEVKTPGALLGVRGTHFRVKWGSDMDTFRQAQGSLEVIEGVVRTQNTSAAGRTLSGAKNAQLLSAGTGKVLGLGNLGQVLPIALLPAPVGQLQEGDSIVALSPLPGAVAYKLQVAKDKSFLSILEEKISRQTRVELPFMAPGNYFLRLTALSATGLEGLPGDLPWAAPGVVAKPAQRGPLGVRRMSNGSFEVTWPELVGKVGVEAVLYRFDLAFDPSFHSIVAMRENVRSAGVNVDQLPAGRYYWRVQVANSALPDELLPAYSGALDAP
jgi:hypothetical protein